MRGGSVDGAARVRDKAASGDAGAGRPARVQATSAPAAAAKPPSQRRRGKVDSGVK
jgi:hypothetical protein